MSDCVSAELEQTVQQLQVSVDSNGTISCSPTQLDVVGTDVLIVAVISNSPGWRFPASDALVVTNGGSQFPYPSWTLNDKQAALFDLNTTSTTFTCTVNVVNAITGQTKHIDPAIKNEI